MLLARLLPRIFLSWVICAALYLALMKLGQLTDLVRAVNEDLVRHFFLTLAFTALTGFCLALALGALPSPGPGATPPTAQLVVALLLAASGPGWLAWKTYGTGAGATIGLILGLSAGIAAPLYGSLQMCLGKASGPPEKALRTATSGFALVAALYYLVLFWAPAATGLLIGPVAVLFTVSATLLWVGLFFATRSPLALAVLSVVVFAVISAGSYGVRPVRQLSAPAPRPTVAEHARRWLAVRQSDIAHGRRYPVFFITSDGGGIRSTYWTASVLGALADANAAFPRHSFVLSGVSGGAVGVAVFSAQVADSAGVRARGGFRQSARAMLSQDFLAAPLAQLLTRDPLESVLCHGLNLNGACRAPAFDRVIALESVFEGAWAAAMGTHRFEESVEALWSAGDASQAPALILNSTNAHNGDPRLVSSFSGLEISGPGEDVLARMPPGQTLRLSTAAVLSARFPLISTEGELSLDGAAEHLVDGGYFDNSGGAAALAAFSEFLAVAQDRTGSDLLPVALLITNDPERPSGPRTWQGCAAPKAAASSARHGLAGLLGQPIGTLDAGRSHAAESRRSAWRRAVADAGGIVIELPLFRCQGDAEFPLGWTLSRAVRAQIDDKIGRMQAQADSPYQQVLDLMSARPGS